MIGLVKKNNDKEMAHKAKIAAKVVIIVILQVSVVIRRCLVV